MLELAVPPVVEDLDRGVVRHVLCTYAVHRGCERIGVPDAREKALCRRGLGTYVNVVLALLLGPQWYGYDRRLSVGATRP